MLIRQRSGDLTTLAQFDLGYNTFFVSRSKTTGLEDRTLIDALEGVGFIIR